MLSFTKKPSYSSINAEIIEINRGNVSQSIYINSNNFNEGLHLDENEFLSNKYEVMFLFQSYRSTFKSFGPRILNTMALSSKSLKNYFSNWTLDV